MAKISKILKAPKSFTRVLVSPQQLNKQNTLTEVAHPALHSTNISIKRERQKCWLQITQKTTKTV
jgi:hypothetical protein